MDNNINSYYDLLIMLRPLLTTNPNISPTQLNIYIDKLNIEKKYPAIHVLDIVEYVHFEDLNNFYENLQNTYMDAGFSPLLKNKIEKAIDVNKQVIDYNKENHYIVRYAYPMIDGNPYIGLDLSTNAIIERNIIEGRNNNILHSSGKIFNNKTTNTYGFTTVRLPIFLENGKYYGNVGVGIRLDNTFFKDIKENDKYIEYQFFSTAEEGRSLVFDSRFNKFDVNTPWPSYLLKENNSKYKNNFVIKIGKNEFRVNTFSDFDPPGTLSDFWIIVIGILSFFLCFLTVKFLFFPFVDNKKLTQGQLEKNIFLLKQAHTDDLTGLKNRRSFFLNLEDRITNNPDKTFSLCFIDLDNFKRINDTAGHIMGDKLLKEYSSKLSSIEDNLYRVGGDEFVLIVENDNLNTTIQKVQDIELHSFFIKDKEYKISQSMGVSFYPKDGNNADELLKKSDIAMYEAKKNGRKQVMFFNNKFSADIEKQEVIKQNLYTALENNEFFLLFQPQVSIQNKEQNVVKIIAVESLLRWNSPVLGLMPPDIFIPYLEKSGMIFEVSEWILKEVCNNIKKWDEIGVCVNFSINLSPTQLTNVDLPSVYKDIVKQYGVNPKRITFEITENAVIENQKMAIEILNNFRKFGFGVAIDDFGKGYSSLNHLKNFPITELKIDKLFIEDVVQDKFSGIIVKGMVKISQELNLLTVIEGLENNEQIRWVLNNIAHDKYPVIIQGYYFSKPLSEVDFISYYKDSNLNNLLY